jgi:hypothetical protein
MSKIEPSFEIRTIGVDGENPKLINFIQDEFTVSHQTAKKMLKPNTLLVYHLSKTEAEEYVKRFKDKGLICKIVQMNF